MDRADINSAGKYYPFTMRSSKYQRAVKEYSLVRLHQRVVYTFWREKMKNDMHFTINEILI
jgi:hypothetical protein